MKSESGYPALHQHEIAIKRMERKHPEKVERTKTLLNVFDKQAFDNLSTYTTEDGTVLPYTSVHLSFIPDRITPPKKKKEPIQNKLFKSFRIPIEQPPEEVPLPPDKKVVVIFNGFSVPDKGHPIYPEIFYNLPFEDMQKAKDAGKAIDVTYLCLGQATGLGGIATKEGNIRAKKEQFRRETKLVATFAEQFLPRDEQEKNNTPLVFHGISMGGLKAIEACFQSNHPQKEADVINPPRIPGLEWKYQPKIPQIVFGYLTEGLIKKRIPELKEEIVPSEYTQELRNFFSEKGFHTKDSFKQRLRKERAVHLNLRNIFKNKLHKIPGEEYPFPVTVHSSALDPITFSFAGLKSAWHREKITNGNVTVDFSMTTHTNNHYPVDDWAKAMEGISVKRHHDHIPLAEQTLFLQ